MAPKKQTKQLKKLKKESESDEDDIIITKNTHGKSLTYTNDSDSVEDSDSESVESESSEEVEEKYDEVDDEDILGDANNEVEDEDEEVDDEKESVADEKDEEVEVEDNNDSDECVYRFTKKKKGLLEDDDDGDAEYFIDEDIKIDGDIYVTNDKRITKPVLTKYERVRVLGERSRQLALGAKPMIKGLINMEPKDVARLELKLKVVPLIIIRTLPTGKKEKWRVSELEIMN
jgi:DNA-directed RNA polymerase I, II, and III subunit RPABC2